MGMYIGDVYLPYVSDFSVDKARKKTEIVKHCDVSVAPHLAEFQPDFREVSIAGTLLAGTVKTVDQYAEDILGAVGRSAAFNFIDFENRAGWLSLNDPDIPESASSVLRKYSLSGQFLPKAKYQPRFRTSPTILANDFSLVLGSDGCDSYVAVPIGATYTGGDDEAIEREGVDGTVTLVKATTENDIRFDISGNEVDVGEVKVWDTMGEVSEANWVRVFSADHEFSSVEHLVVENGLVRIIPDSRTSTRSYWDTFVWNGTAYVEYAILGQEDYFSPFAHVWISGINSDEVVAKARNEDGAVYQYTIRRGLPWVKCDSLTDGQNLRDIRHNGGIARFGYIPHATTIYLADALMSTGDKSCNRSTVSDNYFVLIDVDDDVLIVYADASDDGDSKIEYHAGTALMMPVREEIPKAFSGYVAMVHGSFVSDLFKECEAMTLSTGAAYYTGTDASPKTGNTGVSLDAQDEYVRYNLTGGTTLPLGTYKVFFRAKDSAQATDDLQFYISNATDSNIPVSEHVTLTSSWAYYAVDVTLGDDEDGDSLWLYLKKDTSATNTIDLDYVLWVPVSLVHGNGPQDLAHQAMVSQRMTRELVAR